MIFSPVTNLMHHPLEKCIYSFWFRHPIFALYVCDLIINEFDTETQKEGKKIPRLQISLLQCSLSNQRSIANCYLLLLDSRCLMVSTNQADPYCFYFRISWILMERHWFQFFGSRDLVQGLCAEASNIDCIKN